jgi:hypothetical protein
MDDIVRASGGTGPKNALIPLDRLDPGEVRPVQIEGSWRRIDTLPSPAPRAPVVRAARTALLVWGGVSLAAVSGAALVYAHGGVPIEPEISAETAAALPVKAAEIVAEVPPAAKPVRVIALHPAAAAPAPSLAPARVAKTPSPRAPAAAAATFEEPPPEPVVLAAAIPAPSSALSSETASLPELPTAAEALETTVEARLPRPRPKAPVATASIERQWDDLRASRRIGRHEAIRPRFLYRYGRAPL